MMFGYSDEWWALLFVPVVLWVPFGPFVMGGMGVRCARRPGWWPRVWSVLLPLVPVAVSAVAIILPVDSWDDPRHGEDVLGYLLVYVLGITVLPWLLGYGTTRVVRAVRARRGRERERGRELRSESEPESESADGGPELEPGSGPGAGPGRGRGRTES
ncbi:hypothetical protein J3A78_005631 [Streptomyces sp. PvR006]|uniref:hypothetical protein n=1 Tax=Streptomyces sp. PvR006 TaxID=2817860 RepID=UPI001FD9CCAB|nr:hypothetical protein [Streptomyces sp. PvR006]MBP2585153.1 hypothetical protein [Streptomyces sp. PvR006]